MAAIFRPYKSLNPYIQFVGRVIRSNGNTEYSYVISHLGLNQLQRFQEFRLFDYEDQAFLQRLFSEENSGAEETSFVPVQPTDKSKAELLIRELGTEVIDVESRFVGEDQKIDKIVNQMESLDEDSRRKVLERLGLTQDNVEIKVKKKSSRVRPVDKRKASRKLLNEKEKSIATDILKELGLKQYGRDFNPMFGNFAWVKKRVSREMNKALRTATTRSMGRPPGNSFGGLRPGILCTAQGRQTQLLRFIS